MSAVPAVSSPTPTAQEQRINFLSLLITQLRNQNPLEPLDNNQMTMQLAQMSQLEQLETMGTSFKSVLAATQDKYAASLIGKDVTFGVAGQADPVTGTVSGVTFKDGAPLLAVGQYSVKLEEVQSIQESALASLSGADRDRAAQTLGRMVSYQPSGGGLPVSGYASRVTMHDGQPYVVVGTHEVPLSSLEIAGPATAGLTAADTAAAAALVGRRVTFVPVGSSTPASGVVSGVRVENGGLYLVVGDQLVSPAAVTEIGN